MANDEEPTFERPLYMEVLNRFKDSHIIKVLSGVRRAGKSKILELYSLELLKMGIAPEQIIQRKYTSMEFPEDFNARAMYTDLKDTILATKKNAICFWTKCRKLTAGKKLSTAFLKHTT